MDPTSRRSKPPPHPAGYPVIEDAPVHLAPAVDVRESVRRAREALLEDGRSRSWPLLPASDGEPVESLARVSSLPRGADAPVVAATGPMGVRREPADEPPPSSANGSALYTLAFPVEERRSVPPPRASPFPGYDLDERDEPAEESPRTLAFGASSPRRADSEEAPPAPPEPAPESAPRTVAFERAPRDAAPEAGPRTVAFEPAPRIEAPLPSPRTLAFGGDPRAEAFEPSPRTVAFEPRGAIVPRAAISIGAPSPEPQRSRLPPSAPPAPPPSDPFPTPQLAAPASPAPIAGTPAPDPEPAPVSMLPPSVAFPLHSVAPPLTMPPALAPLLEGPDPTGEREAIARDLAAIGALDERADRVVEREVGAKATLARARALRFRLTLLDAYEAEPARGVPAGVLPIDLAIDAALLVGLSDGAPFVRNAPGGADFPFVRALVAFLRAARPDLPRSVLRERGASAIARITIAGYRPAMDGLARGAMEITLDGRVLALDAAAFVGLVPAANAHRLGALGDLERALALRTGSVAQALELAHRRRR